MNNTGWRLYYTAHSMGLYARLVTFSRKSNLSSKNFHWQSQPMRWYHHAWMNSMTREFASLQGALVTTFTNSARLVTYSGYNFIHTQFVMRIINQQKIFMGARIFLYVYKSLLMVFFVEFQWFVVHTATQIWRNSFPAISNVWYPPPFLVVQVSPFKLAHPC